MIERTDDQVSRPLARAVNLVYAAALSFYNAHKGTGAGTLDISSFFKGTKGRHKEFEVHWRRREGVRRRAFDASLARLRKAIDEFSN
jgi:hypothetical protein